MHEPTVMIAVLSDRRITHPRTKNLWLAPGARSSHDYPAAHYPLVASAHDNDVRPWVLARDEDGPAGRMDLLYIAAHRVPKRGKGY